MKKRTNLLSLALCLLLLAPMPAQAAARKNWYFSSKGQNERPVLPQVDENLARGIGKDEKTLYLTFDAGYENGNVSKIAEILRNNGVTGAFFVLKHFVEAEPELVTRLKEDGNLICNHTATHPPINKLSKEELKAELDGVADQYKALTGENMAPYFRPPEGAYDDSSLKAVSELGYKTVFWSLAYADWDNDKQPDPDTSLKKLESRVHNGAVILLHPTSATNAAILDRFIRDMKEKGYRFGTLEEVWTS
ncbi:MAG: polysaccharide deacetylase family protein [Clostridia bacterium]|nr:polysaccharide deacetylase family protein [Clostridia bacterium]